MKQSLAVEMPKVYKPFLSSTAFNPRSPFFQKFMFEEPPAPKPEELVKTLQTQLETTKAELEKIKADAGAAGDFKKDMLTYKDKVAALTAEIDQMKAKTQADADRLAAEQGNFKALYEQEKKLRTDSDEKLKGYIQKFVESKKRSEVQKEALALGLKPDMVDLLLMMPMAEVTDGYEVHGDITTLKIHGAKDFAEALKRTRPTMFGTPSTPGVDSRAVTSTLQSGQKVMKITPEALEKMRTENPAEYTKIWEQALQGALRLDTTA